MRCRDAIALLLLLFPGVAARAQQTASPPPLDPSRKFEIQDNSFLVEEAFNQEKGIYQNIFGFTRDSGSWQAAFTQEWPLGGLTHQFSYTIAFGDYGGSSGLGDAMLNYRYQVMTETASRPAFSPRVSLILPTGGSQRGYDTFGYQVNLPFSKQRDDFYFHWNAGLTGYAPVGDNINPDVWLLSPHVAASAIWRARPMVNLMLESLFSSEDDPAGRKSVTTISPGVRIGKNVGDAQMVFGGAVPVTFEQGGSSTSLFLYFSYELPFKR